ncbi:XRE family transcriptional regulator [Bacillus sp. FJAT-42376]|uniref:helix-turn-helix transcriptional regulator n=1 Tax=Bacillus sp. FJAT-42376 TaxID=2014076 RepID=UPI000F4EF018|nr:helix-turn-helix transcriptional regulator [Bacillus sp. FJAT-42376]AZB43511.1 XRE family transcriptional regulator [Bacillus sp. FJAT-42376]
MDGKTMKAIRLFHGYSQPEFSKLLGVAEGTIAAIETNRRNVGERVKFKLSQQFELTDELLTAIDRYKKFY